jgi:hypothetical protein
VPEYAYSVSLDYRLDYRGCKLNELHASIIELFDLPGGRYLANTWENGMTFSFKTEQDALLFRLKFGELVN